MNRKAADRIIVRSNDRMKLVIDWFYENKSWLDRQEFLAPLESGVVELQEERLEFTFENKDGCVEIAIYPTEKPHLPAVVTYDYDPTTTQTSNFRFAQHLPPERKMLLMQVMAMDNTHIKEALKYHALMQFMTYYREVVEVEERKTTRPVSAKRRKRGRCRRVQPLIRRAYIIGEFDRATLARPDGVKRAYTKPEHEVTVRGYLRRYKSGKTVWVKPCVKYKGKTAQPKEYEL